MNRLRKIRHLPLYVIVLLCVACCGGPFAYIQWRNQPPEFPPLPDDVAEQGEHRKNCMMGEGYELCRQGKEYTSKEPAEEIVRYYEDREADCHKYYDSDDCTAPGCSGTYVCTKHYTARHLYEVEIDENDADRDYLSKITITVLWEKYDFSKFFEDGLVLVLGP